MAPGAVVAEIIGHVVRVRNALEITLVTGVAFRRGVLISSGMAGQALQADMRPR